MKMHLLDGGRLRMKRRVYVHDAEPDETIELPVISVLFRHAGGNLLFDTGCHPDALEDAGHRWGGLAKLMQPVEPKSDLISNLSQLGLSPDDIDLVVNSHLHPDHCGCNAYFRRASFLCHEDELAAARVDGAEARGYLRGEWDLPMPMQAVGGGHDVLGDGRLVTIALPGHTPGSMGLRARLQRDGEWLLVSDAVSLRRHLDKDEAPRNTWNAELLRRSYTQIRAIEQAGATVLCGHDDAQWRSLRKGADVYE